MRKPNILMILSDDQGPWALGCAGTEELITPNIDALALNGMRLENFYCASPVCSPARASIFTGLMPSAHGVLDWLAKGSMKGDGTHCAVYSDDDANEPIQYMQGYRGFTDYLNAHGYTCGLSGKWHMGDSMTPQMSLSSNYKTQFGGGPYYNHPVIKDGVACTEPSYLTEAITDNAVAFLEKKSESENPFYLSVHYTAPHTPWIDNHPKDIVDLYKDCAFPSLPREPLSKHSMWPDELIADTPIWRENLKGYFAAITAMDRQIGRLMDVLRRLGLEEDTLVVFTSDNGFNCGHHGIWGKGNGTFPLNLYEESVKVPAVFAHKGRIRPAVSDTLISACDLFPTFLELAGIKDGKMDNQPGQSLVPLLYGQSFSDKEHVAVADEYGPARMIRTRQWKYIHRYNYGPHELYDLYNDPHETKNLADDPAYVKTQTECRCRLVDFFNKYADPMIDGAKQGVNGLGQHDFVEPKGKNPWRMNRKAKEKLRGMYDD